MTRAVIVGPRDKLASVIEVLHDLKLIHIIDHHGEDDTFRIGKPLPPASELSENLVKLRSIASILAVKAPPREHFRDARRSRPTRPRPHFRDEAWDPWRRSVRFPVW